MILDSLSEAKKYYNLHPRFQEAFEYIIKNRELLLPERYEIDGNNLYVTVSSNPLRAHEDALLEAHDDYIDIQILFSGKERFGWRLRNRCYSEQAPYDKTKDIVFFNDTPSTYLSIEPGEFLIFFPHDAHAPLIGEGSVKKAVIKVKIK